MTEDDRLAREAANLLQGTCKSIADLGEKFEALQDDHIFYSTLDDLVFCCEGCEWWCPMEEANDTATGFQCDECADDDGDDYE